MEIGLTFWLALLTVGALLLAIAIFIGMTHNSHRSPEEKAQAEDATQRQSRKADRDIGGT